MDMTSTRDGPSIDMDMTSTRDGPSIDMDMTSTRDETYEGSGGDKLDQALDNIAEPMYKLWENLWSLGSLKEMCTEDWWAKRDEDIDKDYIAYINKAAEDVKKLNGKLDKIGEEYFKKKCDHDIFCSNVGVIQHFYSYYEYPVYDY